MGWPLSRASLRSWDMTGLHRPCLLDFRDTRRQPCWYLGW